MPRVIVPHFRNRSHHAVGAQGLSTVDVLDAVGIHAVSVGPQRARTVRQVLETIADEMDARPRSLFQILRHAGAAADETSDCRGPKQGASNGRRHRQSGRPGGQALGRSDSFRQARASPQPGKGSRSHGASGGEGVGDGSLSTSVQKGVAQRFCALRLFRRWWRHGLQIVA